MTTAAASLGALALAWAGTAAGAVECGPVAHDGKAYTVCTVRADEDLRAYLNDDAGAPIGSFERLAAMVEARGEELLFAMNAGMYHPDRSPVGLFIQDGAAHSRIVTGASRDNFGMRPNGVFCIADSGLSVVESRAFAKAPPACRHATQSGPMLVIDGMLHPRFLPDSTSRHIRNGVGVSVDGQTAWFAISDAPVTFHEFARLFRDGLGAPNALYFDGSISRLYARDIGRNDPGFPMGPIVAVVAPRPAGTAPAGG